MPFKLVCYNQEINKSGLAVKNPPANAGGMDSILGPGRPHIPWRNKSLTPQILSLCSRAGEPQLFSPYAATTEAHALASSSHSKRSPHNEKPELCDEDPAHP